MLLHHTSLHRMASHQQIDGSLTVEGVRALAQVKSQTAQVKSQTVQVEFTHLTFPHYAMPTLTLTFTRNPIVKFAPRYVPSILPHWHQNSKACEVSRFSLVLHINRIVSDARTVIPNG